MIKTKITDTLAMDSLGDLSHNIKGVVELSPVKAIFMDSWYSVLPKLTEVEKEFMNVDKFEQVNVKNDNGQEADFGFTFVLMRSTTREYHKREVYSVLDYLGDIGGFAGILAIFIDGALRVFVPAAKTRTILNENFKYDTGNYKKRGGENDPFETNRNHDDKDHMSREDLEARLKNKGVGFRI